VRERDQTVRVAREAVVVHTDKSRVVHGPAASDTSYPVVQGLTNAYAQLPLEFTW
jgi:hypothetical protein